MNQERQWVALDHVRRKKYMRWEVQSRILRGLVQSNSQSNMNRVLWRFYLTRLPYSMSLTRHGRRCMESGRATAISRHIRLSRFAFRTVTGEGDWPGFTRASW